MDFARSLASWFSLPRPFNGNILPSRQQSGNEQSTCCLIKDRPFSEVINVQIPDSHYISDLKLLVKEGASSSLLQGVNTDDLVIYNVSIANRDNTSLYKVYQRINKGDVSVSIADSMATIGSVFPRRDPGHVHVVVGFPDKPGKLLARPLAHICLLDANPWVCFTQRRVSSRSTRNYGEKLRGSLASKILPSRFLNHSFTWSPGIDPRWNPRLSPSPHYT